MFLELVRQIAWGYSHVFKTAFGMGWSQQHASNQSCKSCLTFSLGECILSRTDTKKPHQLLFQIQLAAFAIRKTAHLLPMAKLTDALKEVNHGSWWIRSKTFTLALICIYIIHIHIYVYLRMMVCECIEMHSYRGGRKHLFVKPALLSLQVWHFNNRPDNKHAFCVLCIVYMLCTVVHTTYYCKGPHILFFLPIFIRILIIYHSSIFFECIQLYRHIINETGLHIYIYTYIYVSYEICLNIIWSLSWLIGAGCRAGMCWWEELQLFVSQLFVLAFSTSQWSQQVPSQVPGEVKNGHLPGAQVSWRNSSEDLRRLWQYITRYYQCHPRDCHFCISHASVNSNIRVVSHLHLVEVVRWKKRRNCLMRQLCLITLGCRTCLMPFLTSI